MSNRGMYNKNAIFGKNEHNIKPKQVSEPTEEDVEISKRKSSVRKSKSPVRKSKSSVRKSSVKKSSKTRKGHKNREDSTLKTSGNIIEINDDSSEEERSKRKEYKNTTLEDLKIRLDRLRQRSPLKKSTNTIEINDDLSEERSKLKEQENLRLDRIIQRTNDILGINGDFSEERKKSRLFENVEEMCIGLDGKQIGEYINKLRQYGIISNQFLRELMETEEYCDMIKYYDRHFKKKLKDVYSEIKEYDPLTVLDLYIELQENNKNKEIMNQKNTKRKQCASHLGLGTLDQYYIYAIDRGFLNKQQIDILYDEGVECEYIYGLDNYLKRIYPNIDDAIYRLENFIQDIYEDLHYRGHKKDKTINFVDYVKNYYNYKINNKLFDLTKFFVENNYYRKIDENKKRAEQEKLFAQRFVPLNKNLNHKQN